MRNLVFVLSMLFTAFLVGGAQAVTVSPTSQVRADFDFSPNTGGVFSSFVLDFSASDPFNVGEQIGVELFDASDSLLVSGEFANFSAGDFVGSVGLVPSVLGGGLTPVPSIGSFLFSSISGSIDLDSVTFNVTTDQGFLSVGTLLSEVPVSPPTAAIPLPATFPLIAAGLGFLGFMGWRRKRSEKRHSHATEPLPA